MLSTALDCDARVRNFTDAEDETRLYARSWTNYVIFCRGFDCQGRISWNGAKRKKWKNNCQGSKKRFRYQQERGNKRDVQSEGATEGKRVGQRTQQTVEVFHRKRRKSPGCALPDACCHPPVGCPFDNHIKTFSTSFVRSEAVILCMWVGYLSSGVL